METQADRSEGTGRRGRVMRCRRRGRAVARETGPRCELPHAGHVNTPRMAEAGSQGGLEGSVPGHLRSQAETREPGGERRSDGHFLS